MENILKDNEIVKALECCTTKTHDCLECPYKDFGQCEFQVMQDAFDLINRQQAENESLTRQLNNAKLHQKETHKALQDEKALRLNEDFIKAEAYKEFAERLLSCYEEFDEENEIITFSNLTKAVDDCLKELVGEDNG